MAKLEKRKYEKPKNRHRRKAVKWVEYHCSECDRELDKTARFCVGCGAWFRKAK
jgi:hypothetical protein